MQKTAYEMRISDWSSDVCSSDLHLANLQLERHMETLTEGYTRAIHEKEKTRQIQVLETYAQTERAMAGNIQSLADTMQKETVQIGRAPCRERVVQYV